MLFSLLISMPTLFGAICGYWLCLVVFVKGKAIIPFDIPEWMFWFAGGIIPVATLLQNIAIFRLYLILQNMQSVKIRRALLDFLAGFLPFWTIIFCWTLFWSTICKIGHLPPKDEAQLMWQVLIGYLAGLPLLINAFIAAASAGIFIAFFIQASRNLVCAFIAERKMSIESGST